MDHSIITTQFLKGSYLIIPGTEITLDNEVHYNAYGMTKLVDFTTYFREGRTKQEILEALFSDLDKKNVHLSINHPFAEGMTLQHDFNLTYFTFLEVMNAPYSVEDFIDNEKAIRFFDYLWNSGHYVVGIGGSDAHKKNHHNNYPVGIPKNKIAVKDSSINGILTSMKQGHVLILDEIEAEIEFRNEHNELVLPGSEVVGPVTIKAQANEELDWRIIDNGHCTREITGRKLEDVIKIEKNHFVRIEGKKADKTVFFVNPLVNQLESKPPIHSFSQLLKEFNENDQKLKIRGI